MFVACQLISKMPVKEIVRAVCWKLVWGPPAALISLASFSVRGGIYRTASLKLDAG